ncbi:MAG: 4-hydroxy-3-methylbut-2-enyl diphosphate reductase [Candidatus Pelagibacter sp.]|nr:4-hydroxy-3-methylbut-2-enyl diphosphate reductase [Candidatus Pelagibacter sp.]|tara:strand:- start:16967 stop:17905 length:939 start_codon:yes stop_codon:yes gene_type:complete
MNNFLNILLCAPRGFCAGVDRAVDIVEKSLKKYGKPVYVRHEIVHNKHVVQTLEKKGVIFVDELNEISDKTRPVIFSAHGVPKKVYQEANLTNLQFIDATCPLVSKVHREAELLNKQDYQIILIGHRNHPEVIGTMGQIPNEDVTLIEEIKDIDRIKLKKKKIAYITQTTLSVDDTKNIIDALKTKFPKIKAPIKSDICYATTNRQTAVKNIAAKCDIFFIVGSRQSSNSKRLVEVAKKNGSKQSFLVHQEFELPKETIQNAKCIGVTSGASAPDILVDDLIKNIAKIRDIKIKEVEIVKENVEFKLPKELR